MRKRRKYYFAHKRYAPQFLTRAEVVYDKLRKTIWFSSYREKRAKSFYYFIENKKRGITKH